MRLQKYISRSGLTSRRKAEILISEHRVMVNGKIVVKIGTTVDPEHDEVAVDGEIILIPPTNWIKFNKPHGVLTTARDDFDRPTVYDVLPKNMRGLRYVGRLDYLTEGLLIFTNEGDLANQLQHPSRSVEREYEVVLEKAISSDTLGLLRTGVELEDGLARPVRVETDNKDTHDRRHLRVVLREGRNRELRRMMAAVGHLVTSLRRIRFGPIRLGSLGVGRYEILSAQDVKALNDCIS